MSSYEIIDVIDEMKDSRVVKLEVGTNEFHIFVRNLKWNFEILNNSVSVECINTSNTRKNWSVEAEFEFNAYLTSNNAPYFSGRIAGTFGRGTKCDYDFEGENSASNENPIKIEIKAVVKSMEGLYQYKNPYFEKMAGCEENAVLLLVEGSKVRANKEFLCTHSPVFDAMFNSAFIEKDKKEIPIKGIALESFLHFLRVLYYRYFFTDDENILYDISAFADQYQIQWLVDFCNDFAIEYQDNTCKCRLGGGRREKFSFELQNQNTSNILDEMADSRQLQLHLANPSYLSAYGYVKNMWWEVQLSTVNEGSVSVKVYKPFASSVVARIDFKFDQSSERIKLNFCESKDVEKQTLYFDRNTLQSLTKIVEVKLTVEKIMDPPRFSNSQLDCLLNADKKDNVVFVLGNERTVVNKKFIAMHSPVFAKLFERLGNKARKIKINDVKYTNFIEFLRILHYNKTCATNQSRMIEVFNVANQYQVPCVMNFCENWLLKECQHISTEWPDTLDETVNMRRKQYESATCSWRKKVEMFTSETSHNIHIHSTGTRHNLQSC